MSRTAWTKPNLQSDRLAPAQPRPATPKNKGKAKEEQSAKSPAVRGLQALLTSLKAASQGTKPDTGGGCFCQARSHELSPYTPLCMHCGLILCKLNPPYRICPHCTSPLLTESARGKLIQKIEGNIEETIQKEHAAIQQALEEAHRGRDSFPSLRSSASTPAVSRPATPPGQNQADYGHRVLSLNPKTKKVTVTTYKTISSKSITPAKTPTEPAEPTEVGPPRIPPPPKEVVHFRAPPEQVEARLRDRPWVCLLTGSPDYVPQARIGEAEGAAVILYSPSCPRKWYSFVKDVFYDI